MNATEKSTMIMVPAILIVSGIALTGVAMVIRMGLTSYFIGI